MKLALIFPDDDGPGLHAAHRLCAHLRNRGEELWRSDARMLAYVDIRYVIILKSRVEIIRTNIQTPLASASQVNCGSTDGNHSIANRVSASPLLERCRVTSTVFRGAIATERHNLYAPFISMRHFYMRHL
jgi:hypothetical protein